MPLNPAVMKGLNLWGYVKTGFSVQWLWGLRARGPVGAGNRRWQQNRLASGFQACLTAERGPGVKEREMATSALQITLKRLGNGT